MKNNFHGFFHYIAYWEPPPLLIRGKGVLRKLAKGARASATFTIKMGDCQKKRVDSVTRRNYLILFI